MAYTPTNWQTGDTITAEKLNKIENGVESGQNAWSVETVYTTLFDDSITTSIPAPSYPPMADLQSAIVTEMYGDDANLFRITFDGDEYIVEKKKETSVGAKYIGGLPDISTYTVDFSVYPFCILFSSSSSAYFFTETVGTYSVKIETVEKTATTDKDFDVAVSSVVEPQLPKTYYFSIAWADNTFTTDLTYSWLHDNYNSQNRYILNYSEADYSITRCEFVRVANGYLFEGYRVHDNGSSTGSTIEIILISIEASKIVSWIWKVEATDRLYRATSLEETF